MEIKVRKPFQGLLNIVRFNWHYYVVSGLVVIALSAIHSYSGRLGMLSYALLVLIICSIIISLAVSSYIYDFSDLYRLSWLTGFVTEKNERILNIHAGFDETSDLLKSKIPNCEFIVVDFYDPAKHTEVSIKRARRAYPPFPGTQQASTNNLPFPDRSVSKIFTILSAHEIRNDEERISFFRELHRLLEPNGEIIVTEHLRNAANFLAYNIGFLHFHSRTKWLHTFNSAGLSLSKEIKITPFITSFILRK